MRPRTWPRVPQSPTSARADFAKARYQAELDEAKALARDAAEADKIARALEAARIDAAQAAEDASRQAVQAAYLEVGKGIIDRSLKRAEFVTAAAGSIGTIYSGLLALVYSSSADVPNPLPARGIVPALFLAAAFVFSAVYVSFLRRARRKGNLLPGGVGGAIEETRLISFITWATESAMQRAWALRTAVVSLGAGVALLPLAFVRLQWWQTVAITLFAISVVGFWLLGEAGCYTWVRPRVRPWLATLAARLRGGRRR